MNSRRFLASLGVAATIAGGASLLPSSTPPAEAYTYNYGAIAYSAAGRVAVTRINFRSPQAAVNAVMARCGYNCGYFSFTNSCGAVAYKYMYGRTRIGKARGYPTRAAASRAARAQAGYGSHVRGWACTSRYR